MNTVNLYEDNAGGLYLNIEGSDAVYCGLQNAGTPGGFAEDAQSLLDGDEWNGVDRAPISDLENTNLVASYDGQSVALHHYKGRAAQMYIDGKYE